MRQDLKDRLRTESNFKFVAAAIVVLGLIGTLIFAPKDKDFFIQSEREVNIAMQICQNSAKWVSSHRSDLKLGAQSKLDHIKVQGKIPKFKHVKTPQVIFISSGFVSPNMTNDMFCEVTNPASKTKYYYDYENRIWTDKIRFRR